MKRPDIFHCDECKVCSDMHDHHCGVLQVCVCAKNYKYFVLFIFYSSMQLITTAISIVVIPTCYTNEKLKELYSNIFRYLLAIGLGVFGVVLLMITCVFVSDSPSCSETPDTFIVKALRLEHKDLQHLKGEEERQAIKDKACL